MIFFSGEERRGTVVCLSAAVLLFSLLSNAAAASSIGEKIKARVGGLSHHLNETDTPIVGPGWDTGAGSFGRWAMDRYGLPAYEYEMDPLNDLRAVWLKGNAYSNLHWHQLGNDHVNAIATNMGYVQMFYNDSAQRWLNLHNPAKLAYAGGFGFVSDGAVSFSSYYPYRPAGVAEKRIFGEGYFEKEISSGGILLNETVFAPAGDLPVLIMRVRLKNLSAEEKTLTYLPYFDVDTYDLFPPFLTAYAPDR
ncbi:MAG: hypothetical protein PHY31_08650, partial [Smithellaceae bacterium]|nr:hypothetical protein [Smithellaceae bacterium]